MQYEITVSTIYKKRKKALKRISRKYRLQYQGWYRECFISTGAVSQKEYRKLEFICAKKKLKLKIQNQFSTRSANYRQAFFEKNPPVIGERYFCAYCGCLIHKKKVTVDHLYPVNSVQKSIRIHKKLKKKGWESINDERNLVAACEHCNKRKSSRMGKWIILGKLGRYNWLWIVRHTIRICLFATLMYLAFLTGLFA